MNASILTADLADARLAATPRAEAFGKGLLLVNGIVLGSVALGAALVDLAGHFLDIGPQARLLSGNLDTIGFFEAHGLALMMAIIMLANRKATGAGWNWLGAAVHLLLGASNILFWRAFADQDLLMLGVLTTGMHIGFFLLQTVAALARSPEILGGPGALFRATAAITIVTGIGLHVGRLPLGPEVFQAQLFTPLVDAIFAIPMTIAGIAGLLLWKRAILPTLWEKLAYGFVVLFFAGSMVLHAKTIFTWDTSYVNSFPAFYPLIALVYLSLIGWFAVTRRFRAAGLAPAGRM